VVIKTSHDEERSEDVNVALPSIQRDRGLSQENLQW
jgi:hypothetical protein